MSEGRVLADRYELRRLLGRGGMAEVFAAHDRLLDREVAVKLLLDRFREDESFTRRFEAEARHVARLNHPNLVAVYDTGHAEVPSGGVQPYIVMELVDGRSLQETIAAGGLTEDRALEITADVCAALHYAHERGLVHRDIKPGNILLADDGSVKVTDFGIARAVDNETVTRTAAVLGTAAYLSPEQAQGLDVDPRSDLYSLGVVLYESLIGSQPFNGDSAVTVAYQHVQEAPRPPRELAPDISVAAEAITMRALAKNPANRYQDAAEMRSDMSSARVGGRVAAPAVMSPEDTALLQPANTTRPMRTHEQERRRKGLIYTLLALLALLALAGGAWALLNLGGEAEPDLVTVPNVVGESRAEAERLIIDAELEVGQVDEDFSDDVEPGDVLSQSPEGFGEAEVGTEVDLTISAGEEVTTVPDLEGLTEEEARSELRARDLLVGSPAREASDEVEEGRIIRSTPEAGEEVPVGSEVSYVISSGEEMVIVRPVVNFTEEDAIARLADQGLEFTIEREFSDVVAEGTVISQDPGPGERVPAGSSVNLVISRGPEEAPEPAPEAEEPEPEPEEPEPEPEEPEPEPDEPEPEPDEPEPEPDEPEPEPDEPEPDEPEPDASAPDEPEPDEPEPNEA